MLINIIETYKIIKLFGKLSIQTPLKWLKTFFLILYFQISVFPSELNILNVTQVNTVNGKEHTHMRLVCLVKSGKPLEELRWKTNRTIIKHGGPGKLVYSFVPKTTDHNSVYTCEAQNSYMAIPLSKSIHLNIKCKNITLIYNVT